MKAHRSPVVKCVPNFSEGRDGEILGALRDAAQNQAGVLLSDWSCDVDHHRSVFTLLGAPEAVCAALLKMAEVAVQHIDLTTHQGEHPRIGAMDVVPFIPARQTTLGDCVSIARGFAAELADHFQLPVYLYGAAATQVDRERLELVRRGGFERLQERIDSEGHHPDFGPPVAHPTAGATCVGAREPLIAYNVNLATDDLSIARAIASRLRERGGGLAGLKAMGVQLVSTGIVQVSFNVTRPDEVSLFQVYSAVQAEAQRHGVEVLESELIGTLRAVDVCNALRDALRLHELSTDRVDDVSLQMLDTTGS